MKKDFLVIHQIEKRSETQQGEQLFSTDKNTWDVKTSEFDQCILNKQNVLIIIEDSKKNIFGAFIASTIERVTTIVNKENEFQSENEDPRSFLFEWNDKEHSAKFIGIEQGIPIPKFTVFEKNDMHWVQWY